MVHRHHLVGLPRPIGTVHFVDPDVVFALERVAKPFQRVLESLRQEGSVEEPFRVGFQGPGVALDVVETKGELDEGSSLGKLSAERQSFIDCRFRN